MKPPNLGLATGSPWLSRLQEDVPPKEVLHAPAEAIRQSCVREGASGSAGVPLCRGRPCASRR